MNAMPVVLLVALSCVGCAAQTYRPVVDTGVSRGNYEDDVYDCQQLAAQRPAGDHVAGGIVVGAAIGALFGLAVGLEGDDVAHLAAWGAATGGLEGAGWGTVEQRSIVARCMEGRGYMVLAD
jgi:uncharacterized protein YcfJ